MLRAASHCRWTYATTYFFLGQCITEKNITVQILGQLNLID